ncbi:RNA pyrophosphohydrolase [Pseudomonas syringae pv. actinidiae]|uniref:NUDIX hydrolase n=1 Tax=Pseudomonas syringae TaxID=317 RepID=UPI000A236730|nr:NUDIX domain-containing protein [Pseudomonas syringae]OSR74439.1 RNA pyrophosphohydrolase [Pseudomonas syringae pv. actinidiae]
MAYVGGVVVQRRLASRILVISPSHRLLLFKIHYETGALAGRTYWATPGGKLRDDETFEDAAIRELREETGIAVDGVGDCLIHKEFVWQMPDGEAVVAVENYYVVHAHEEDCTSANWTPQERDAVCDVRWWSESEIAASTEEILPPDLPILFARCLRM